MTRRKAFELWEDSTPATLNIVSIENKICNTLFNYSMKFNTLKLDTKIYEDLAERIRSICIAVLFSLNDSCVKIDELNSYHIFDKLNSLSVSYPGFDHLFQGLAKCLRDLAGVPTVALYGLEHVLLGGCPLKNSDNEKYTLSARSSRSIESLMNALSSYELDEFCSIANPKELTADGTDKVVIFLGPLNWHLKVLADPPSKHIVFIQPSIFSNKIPICEIFKCDSFVFGRSPISVSLGKVIDLAYKETRSCSSGEVENLSNVQDFLENFISDYSIHPSGNQSEGQTIIDKDRVVNITLMSGTEYICESGVSIWLINLNGKFEERQIIDEFNVKNGEYLINFINPDNDEQSVRAFDPENWLKIMEIWKQKLRQQITRMSYLENSLKNLGAISAKDTNIRNWINPDVCSPKRVEDFLAVLRFSGIDTPEEQGKYIELARVVNGGRIMAGKIIHSERREKARKYIEKYIYENGVETLKGDHPNILMLNGYEFKLEKISMSAVESHDALEA